MRKREIDISTSVCYNQVEGGEAESRSRFVHLILFSLLFCPRPTATQTPPLYPPAKFMLADLRKQHSVFLILDTHFWFKLLLYCILLWWTKLWSGNLKKYIFSQFIINIKNNFKRYSWQIKKKIARRYQNSLDTIIITYTLLVQHSEYKSQSRCCKMYWCSTV